MIDYFLNDGFEADAWGPKEGSAWSEQNATAQDLYGVVVCEPCNYASNVAYFHDATEMCRSRWVAHDMQEFLLLSCPKHDWIMGSD